MFSLFNVVQFKNIDCQAASNVALQGRCFTKTECKSKGGTEDGNCASSFGVCCVFRMSGTDANCGGTLTENGTFIESPGFPNALAATVRTCGYRVNRCAKDIRQIRLDFVAATLSQPLAANGVCGGATVDTLTITPGANNVGIPVLCGNLAGQHMYLDAGNADPGPIANLAFVTVAAPATAVQRSWRIRVSQIEGDSPSRAPNGCLQFFTGARSTVKSFNFDGSNACATGCTLATQNYRACFRTEQGMCGAQFAESVAAAGKDSFQIDGQANAVVGAANCNANGGVQILGVDASANPALATGDLFCGTILSTVAGATVPNAVRSNNRPFSLSYIVNANPTGRAGFSIDVTQAPC